MAMSAEHRSKFTSLHRKWWRLHMSKKILDRGEKPKKQTKKTKETKHLFSLINFEFGFTIFKFDFYSLHTEPSLAYR